MTIGQFEQKKEKYHAFLRLLSIMNMKTDLITMAFFREREFGQIWKRVVKPVISKTSTGKNERRFLS